MQARSFVRTTIDPPQAVTQSDEDAMRLPRAEGLPQSPAATADEERRVGCRRHILRTLPPVARERVDGAGNFRRIDVNSRQGPAIF